KTAKKRTSGRPSRAALPPGTTNATESVLKTWACPSVICFVGPRHTEYASTHGISTATSTTHESASKYVRNHQPSSVSAPSLQKFAPTGVPAYDRPTASATSTRPAGRRSRLCHSGSASQTRRNVTGIRTNAISRIDGQSDIPPRCRAASNHPTSAARTPSSASALATLRGSRRRRTALVRRQCGPPLADRLERIPVGGLRRLIVERRVDVGHDERLDRRCEPLQLAECRLDRATERELEAVDELER